MREQRWLGVAGGAGGKNDLRAVGFRDGRRSRAKRAQDRRVRGILQRGRRQGLRLGGQNKGRLGAGDRLIGRRELNEMIHEWAVRHHGLAQLAEVGQGRLSEEGVAFGFDQAQAANHLWPLQAQIERRMNHADFEAGVL